MRILYNCKNTENLIHLKYISCGYLIFFDMMEQINGAGGIKTIFMLNNRCDITDEWIAINK